MFKVLTKFGFSAGAITGTVFATENVLVESGDLADRPRTPKTKLSAISTFEEIDIYAKEHGCTFAFVEAWKKQTVYSVNSFVSQENKQEKKTEWEDKAKAAANTKKHLCQRGKTVIFAHNNTSNKFTIQEAPKT